MNLVDCANRVPSFAKEGWLRHKKMVPFFSGADGVVVSSHRLLVQQQSAVA